MADNIRRVICNDFAVYSIVIELAEGADAAAVYKSFASTASWLS